MESWIWALLDKDYFLWGSCVVGFFACERLIPQFPRQRPWRKDSAQDLLWLLVNEVAGNFFARTGLVIYLIHLTGLREFLAKEIPLLGAFAAWPFLLKFLAVFLCVDFLSWCSHYFLHRSRYFSRIHVLHHSSQQLDWLAAFRAHWLDSLFMDLSFTIPMSVLPLDRHMVLIFSFIAIGWTFFMHANVRIGTHPVFRWIGSPLTHYWHHSASNRLPHGQNFGTFTLIWDHIFGTFYMPADLTPPKTFGLFKPERYSSNLIMRFIGPFLPGAYSLTGKARS